jgi:RHH-type proline utilization regulon transcriptional repressor/proline dehydrogenase/delta 1-pyrroline-5-carboxylate dehydrogenase
VLALTSDQGALLTQIGAVLATGNIAVVERKNPAATILAELPAAVAARIHSVARWQDAPDVAVMLFAGDRETLLELNRAAAQRNGAIIPVQSVSVAGLLGGGEDYSLEMLLEEVSVSTNTAAAGGNANLMTIG